MRLSNIISGATLISLVTALLASCSGNVPSTPTSPASTATIGEGAMNITRILLEYNDQSPGLTKRLEISANGETRLNVGASLVGTAQLEAERVDQLVKRFNDAGFFELQEEYPTGGPTVMDDIASTITFTHNGRTRTVTTWQVSAKGVVPQPLVDLIADLHSIGNSIKASHTPTPGAIQVPDNAIGYEYTGGVAGYRKEMFIGPTGIVALDNRGRAVGTIQLDKEHMAQLLKRFEDTRFFDLQDKYEQIGGVVADEIYYKISFTQNGRTKTVSVAQSDMDKLAPQSLRDLISDLDSIGAEIEHVAPSPTVTK